MKVTFDLVKAGNFKSSLGLVSGLVSKMPRPYENDLRWRAVWLSITQGFSAYDISKFLCISKRSVYRYLARFDKDGDVRPSIYQHGPSKLLGELEQLVLLRIITNNPGIYLSEVESKLFDKFGVHMSLSTICRTLKYMGCTRQVIQRIALQRSDDRRAKFMAEVSMYDPSMLLWIDESGCDRRNYLRNRAYSPIGMTPRDHCLMVRGTRYSAIPIMSVEGIHDVSLFEGNVNGVRFEHFLRNSLQLLFMTMLLYITWIAL